MKKTYQLIKLKTETVQDLKKIMNQSGIGSIDDMINSMIQITESHRLWLKEVGWESNFERY